MSYCSARLKATPLSCPSPASSTTGGGGRGRRRRRRRRRLQVRFFLLSQFDRSYIANLSKKIIIIIALDGAPSLQKFGQRSRKQANCGCGFWLPVLSSCCRDRVFGFGQIFGRLLEVYRNFDFFLSKKVIFGLISGGQLVICCKDRAFMNVQINWKIVALKHWALEFWSSFLSIN